MHARQWWWSVGSIVVASAALSCAGPGGDQGDATTGQGSGFSDGVAPRAGADGGSRSAGAADDTTEEGSPDGAPFPDTATNSDTTLGDASHLGDGSVTPGPPIHVEDNPHCDVLVPEACILPWPSDRWTAADSDSPTGVHLAIDDGASWLTGPPIDPVPYARLDGFSPNTQVVFLLAERPDLAQTAGPETIDSSLSDDHPTVLLDLDTGKRLPHWVELDAQADDPSQVLVFLRPASRLPAGHRIGVAVRRLRAADSGNLIAASPAFAALRDGVPTDSAGLEARRPGYEALFEALDAAGVARGELQLAWWFQVGTLETIRSDLLAMRNDAIERLGPDGIGCTVQDVSEQDNGVRIVHGTVATPWYLDAHSPPAHLVRNGEGLPTMADIVDVPFVAIVPPSAKSAAAPVPLITWGHGLFGEAESTVTSGDVMDVAEESGVVVAGTNWYGMSQPELPFLGSALADVALFPMVADNGRQGIVNFLALTTTLAGTCRFEPAFASNTGQPVIDPAHRYFVGGSQGSILGATYLAVAPDIERGALIVGGANFSFMIERSIHYRTFGPILQAAYPRRLETAMLMVLSQHVWDAFETAAWIDIASKGSPTIAPTPFVYLVTHNDAQVPNLASDLAARIAAIPAIEGSAWVPWGVPTVSAPAPGPAWLAVDLGDPPPPPGNTPPEQDYGGHYNAGFEPDVRAVIGQFLETGTIVGPP